MRFIAPLLAAGTPLLAAAGLCAGQPGPANAPLIPGTPWRVHDAARPAPPVVAPGASFSQGAPPPADAIVLFDGRDLAQWQGPDGGEPGWIVEDGAMRVPAPVRGRDIRTKGAFADFQLHLEFATPAPAAGSGQGRGNSGILFNGLYEVQILDSHQNQTYPDGQAGAVYGQSPPLVNASKPPGEWQTYDIIFESPRWDAEGKLVKPAAVTVIHNGVVLHHRLELFGQTDGVGGLPNYSLGTYPKPHPPEVFIQLQDHRNPVRFRNVWLRPLGKYDAAAGQPAAAPPAPAPPAAQTAPPAP